MPKFPFNYCTFLALLLCSCSAFALDLKQSLVVSIIIFAVAFVSFVIVFIIQQATSSQTMSIIYALISTSLFILVKMILKSKLLHFYEIIYINFDYLLIPILLCGVLISYTIDDKNAVPLYKQLFSIFGILTLNIVSFSILGFIRELLGFGTIWGEYVSSYTNNFFASPAFSFLYIAIVYGTINTLLVNSKKTKKRFNLYVQKMEENLTDRRVFK